MRTVIGSLILVCATSVSAFPEGMDLQKMQESIGKMTACMEKIDQQKIEALQREGEAVVNRVNKLCSAGKRGEAMDTAMSFASRVNTSPELKQVRECGKIVQMAPTIPMELQSFIKANENRHVCDGM